MNTEDNEKKDPFDGEYIGNIWGWKISFIGLGFIVVLTALIVYRHLSMNVPFRLDEPEPTTQEQPIDSLQQDTVE